MSAAPATRPSTPAPMSETARLINTFIAPSKTFTDLKRVRRWWVPWLLITVISYALVAVVAQKIGFQQVTENQLKLSPKRAEQLEKLPPDRRARQMAVAVTFTKAISYAIPAVNLLFFLVIAAVLMATLNFGAGAEIPFGTALAVVTYAYLPGLVRVLLAVIAVLAGLNPRNLQLPESRGHQPGVLHGSGGLPNALPAGLQPRCRHAMGAGADWDWLRLRQQAQSARRRWLLSSAGTRWWCWQGWPSARCSRSRNRRLTSKLLQIKRIQCPGGRVCA